MVRQSGLRWVKCVSGAVLLTVGLGATSWGQTPGSLSQETGPEGCISETGSSGACTDGQGLDGAYSAAVSKDGKHVYVASLNSDAVAVLQRTK